MTQRYWNQYCKLNTEKIDIVCISDDDNNID